ncbi:uncharacterized protein EDB91DRAFT_1089485 [Suillus paluster]|uniref:uncharacterized protein n=1 Tax=Suillus paluster TaxID=48578 RepID=UPI001B86FF9A|nr:uncharacterized protein EDB91DRAFT_1089485 [Suillus paluster]KAG1719169.1 hypothetical protein EDB91DRAFT_1089485 [Suillus paluster]
MWREEKGGREEGEEGEKKKEEEEEDGGVRAAMILYVGAIFHGLVGWGVQWSFGIGVRGRNHGVFGERVVGMLSSYVDVLVELRVSMREVLLFNLHLNRVVIEQMVPSRVESSLAASRIGFLLGGGLIGSDVPEVLRGPKPCLLAVLGHDVVSDLPGEGVGCVLSASLVMMDCVTCFMIASATLPVFMSFSRKATARIATTTGTGVVLDICSSFDSRKVFPLGASLTLFDMASIASCVMGDLVIFSVVDVYLWELGEYLDHDTQLPHLIDPDWVMGQLAMMTVSVSKSKTKVHFSETIDWKGMVSLPDDPQKQMKWIELGMYGFVRWSRWNLQIGRDASQIQRKFIKRKIGGSYMKVQYFQGTLKYRYNKKMCCLGAGASSSGPLFAFNFLNDNQCPKAIYFCVEMGVFYKDTRMTKFLLEGLCCFLMSFGSLGLNIIMVFKKLLVDVAEICLCAIGNKLAVIVGI